jgi:type II secretory ATPase GspE/PulE/Tfp pilus assembly ATPase PilB-like protein
LRKKYGIKEAFRGEGCEFCAHTGYKGRLGLFEQFEVTPEVSDAISAGASMSALREIARKNGMRTLVELGAERVASGDTTPEEMMRVVGEE